MNMPVRDVCRHLHRIRSVEPSATDYATWSPVGPGARRCLESLDATPHDLEAMAAQRRQYASHGSATGRSYSACLWAFHRRLVSAPERQRALERLAGGAWQLHATQSGFCHFEKYSAAKDGLRGVASLANTRWYRDPVAAAATWKERETQRVSGAKCARCGTELLDDAGSRSTRWERPNGLALISATRCTGVAGEALELKAGDAVCVRTASGTRELSKKCCAYELWTPESCCAVRAPSGAHSPATDKSAWHWPGHGWVCRSHKAVVGDAPSSAKDVKCRGAARDRFPAAALARLLPGQGKDLFFPFLLEVMEAHARRASEVPPPFSDDVLIHAMWIEHPCDELDATSVLVAKGLDKLHAALVSLAPGADRQVDRVSAVILAAAAVRRFGGREWCSLFLDELSMPANAQCLLRRDAAWLSFFAMDQAIQTFRMGVNPFTCAHQPQSIDRKKLAATWPGTRPQEKQNRTAARS